MAFLVITLVLVALLLVAKAKLTSSGDVTIDINDGEKVITTESGIDASVDAGQQQGVPAFGLRRRRFVRHVQVPGHGGRR